MRFAKILLLVSLATFLFAASWALFTGQVVPVTEAHAQGEDPFVSVAATQNGLFTAITASGEVWEFRHGTGREFGQVAKLGRLGGE